MNKFIEICINNKQIRDAIFEYTEKKEEQYKKDLERTGNTHYQGAIFAMQMIRHEIKTSAT